MNSETGALRSKGYKRLHAFLCAVAALLLLCCINSDVMGRELITGGIAEGMRASQLSDAKIPFNGTVTEIIRKDYVTDDLVTAEDVADAVDTMRIPTFLAGKLGNYGALLSGASDQPVHITADEIVELLEDSEDTLYDKCLLVIEDADKEAIRTEAASPLGTLNGLSDFFYGSKFGRALAHFRVSVWRMVLDIVLLLLLTIRWATVRERSGEDRAGGLRGMGLTLMIPSCILLVILAVGGISALFVKDGVVGLYPLLKAIRVPLWGTVAFEAACGFVLTTIAKYLRSDVRAERLAARETRRQQSTQRRAQGKSSTSGKAAPAAAPANRFCVSCGKQLPAGAGFCIYCGAKQSGPAAPAAPAAPAEPAAPAPAPAEPAASVTPAAPASESGDNTST